MNVIELIFICLGIIVYIYLGIRILEMKVKFAAFVYLLFVTIFVVSIILGSYLFLMIWTILTIILALLVFVMVR